MSTRTSLSIKRILISLCIFILIPLSAGFLNQYMNQLAISYMVTMNIGGAIMIFYDWNLFGIHYNRSKHNIFDTVLYTSFGALCLMLWLYVGFHFFQSNLVIPGTSDLISYGYARPGMLIAFSFMQACILSIGYKCLTDHFDVRGKEIQSILLSGIVFGFLYTVLYLPYFSYSLFFRTYIYNIVLISFMSYLYNQSHSLFPGILAFTIVYLVGMYSVLI